MYIAIELQKIDKSDERRQVEKNADLTKFFSLKTIQLENWFDQMFAFIDWIKPQIKKWFDESFVKDFQIPN